MSQQRVDGELRQEERAQGRIVQVVVPIWVPAGQQAAGGGIGEEEAVLNRRRRRPDPDQRRLGAR